MSRTAGDCPIADVEALVLRAPSEGEADLDGSRETVVVRIVDEAGRAGLGETDAPASVARELVLMDDVHDWSRGLRSMLLGRDPYAIRSLWFELYEGTIYHGRRGLGLHSLSAVDIALHDLVGKQLGRPCYELLGGARRAWITPYATIYAGGVGGRSLRDVMDATFELCELAVATGFRAVKVELLMGDLATDRELVGCIRDSRALLGQETVLLIDFGYRWSDWREALWVLSRVEDCDLYLAEATLQHDDLAGHRKLAARVETRIGGAEFAAGLHECREWLELGGVDVLQPDINRCGGLTEIRRIAELAELYGAQVVPHCWKTGLTAAAARHFQAATPNAPMIEIHHPALFDSPLRRELVRPEPTIENGRIPLPVEPGLGVELVEEAVDRYRVT